MLAQVGDPRDEVRRGLVSEAEAEAVTGLYGRAAADRVIIERALMLEARLRPLTDLGRDPVPLPPSRLRVVAMDRASRMASSQVIGGYVTAALTHLLRRQPRGQGWRHTLLLCGAERLRGDVLDRLSDACEFSGTGLVLTYRSLAPHVRDRLGRGNAAVAFMRLGNAEDARVASEQIGTEHRFVVAQLTDTVGTSLTDTAGDAYTSTVGSASSVALSTSSSHGSGRSGGRGQSWAGMSPFAPRTTSSHGETSYSAGVSDSASITEGITTGTAWGRQTARAAGITCVGRPHRPAIPGVPRGAARPAAAPAQRGDRQLCVSGRPPGGAGRRQPGHPRPAHGDAADPGRGRAGDSSGRPRGWRGSR